MSVRNEEIIPATTALRFSTAFNVYGSATITAGVLADDEGVQIQYTHDGTTFQSLYLNGVLQEITNQHSTLTIAGPGLFRLLKSTTISAVSVNKWETELM